ncbi:hypothetical protein [uncultured Methanobrevibacter sp.]|uniref:hypothetical protein n=1 Tax=uncultured Methanobrevibacter sp. TaxID=253161 RepID=UPI0025D05DC7|nr:hypothetical protein [uncultured Methanobrevibacter sp.]
MTSEVLIMTPSAVTIAADSVVAINGNKTYECVNKLFMLSKNPPMGIMIYNNANFMAIPFETLIKDFRKQIIDDGTVNTVDDFRNKFEEYLEKEPKKNNFPILSLQDKIKIFTEHMANEVNNLDENTIEKWLLDNGNLDVFDKYKDIIFIDDDSLINFNNCLNSIIPEFLDSDKIDEFHDVLKNIFVQVMVLENYTGVAIVGFETDKLFPSCTLFKIRYIYDDKFIFDDIKNDEVGGKKGVIFAPLAQTDVIELFLTSLDTITEKQLKMYFNNVLDGYNDRLKGLIKSEESISKKDAEKIISILDKVQNKHPNFDEHFDKFISDLKLHNKNPILNFIMFLPKDELSNLAESLINITSLKRKVQDGLETVGGDVDVAVITKGDGFIWTKRKHYFKPELNPHYFDNKV